MKKMTIRTLILATLLLGNTTLPATLAFADTQVFNETTTAQDYDIKAEKLAQEINKYKKVTKEGNDTIISIDDSDLFSALINAGYDIPQYVTAAAGVTKIIWHGQARNGNVDMYLSKNWLNNMSKAGTGAIIGVLGTLLPGIGWGGALGAISGVISGGNFKHGRVFVIRSFAYQYWYYQ